MIRKKYFIPLGEQKRDYHGFLKQFDVNNLILPFEFDEESEDGERLEWQESKSQ